METIQIANSSMEPITLTIISGIRETALKAAQLLRHDQFTIWNGKPPFRYIEIGRIVPGTF